MRYTEFVPYDVNGLGHAYNACAEACKTEWVCFRDSDVMLLGNYGHLLERVLADKGSKYDVLTCVTNRIGIPPQQVEPLLSMERDLTRLASMAQRCYAQYGENITPVKSHIAGFWMCFKKSVWESVKFPLVGTGFSCRDNPKVLGIDFAWSDAVMRAGYRIGILRGLCAIHYFRLDRSHHLDRRHLRPDGFTYKTPC